MFSFCNKETFVVERLELLSIDGTDIIDALENFELDKCHAFDPNEEYKMRIIIRDIDIGIGGSERFGDGNSRFEKALKKIAADLREKQEREKRSLLRLFPFFRSSISSSLSSSSLSSPTTTYRVTS